MVMDRSLLSEIDAMFQRVENMRHRPVVPRRVERQKDLCSGVILQGESYEGQNRSDFVVVFRSCEVQTWTPKTHRIIFVGTVSLSWRANV